MDNNNLNQQIIAQNEQTIAQQQTQQVVQQQVQNQQPVVYAQQPQVVYVQQPVQQPVQQKPSRGKGLAFSIVSMSLGIFGFVFAIITFFMCLAGFGVAQYAYDVEELAPIFAVVIVYGLIVVGCSIPSLILGAKGKKLIGSKMGTTGVVFSIINFVLTALCVLMCIAMTAIIA